MATLRWSERACITLVSVTLLAVAPLSHAALRTPQVPVSGTALATFFASQGQTINVNTAQLDAQRFSLIAGASFQALSFGSTTWNLGVYNATAVTPALYQILPGAVSPGWTAFASFRSAPDRLVVNLFDAANALQGTVTYLGADHNDFAFYSQLPGGTAYSQDSRNPGGRAQMLAFSGTGARAGSTWFAFESTPGPGGDYADAIALVTLAIAPVPALPSTWARVKALYR